MTEDERVALLARVLAGASGGEAPRGVAPGDQGLQLGIGDDAAVVRVGDALLVLSVDAQVEGVHFRREWLSLADLGYRAVMTAASDLAAMGAKPLAILASLVLPSWLDDGGLEQGRR